MGLSYKKLWVLLAQNEISKTKLREMTGIGTSTLAKLGKNEQVALSVLEKICQEFNCDFCDIIEYIPEIEVK